jgi:hypothetical protein
MSAQELLCLGIIFRLGRSRGLACSEPAVSCQFTVFPNPILTRTLYDSVQRVEVTLRMANFGMFCAFSRPTIRAGGSRGAESLILRVHMLSLVDYCYHGIEGNGMTGVHDWIVGNNLLKLVGRSNGSNIKGYSPFRWPDIETIESYQIFATGQADRRRGNFR